MLAHSLEGGYGPLLNLLIRSRPKGYFNIPRLTSRQVSDIEEFLHQLDSKHFDLEHISRIWFDAPRCVSVVHTTDGLKETWIGDHESPFKLLADSVRLSAHNQRTLDYSICSGILFTFGGCDSWDCVTDLTRYRHFWWDHNILRMAFEGGSGSSIVAPTNDLPSEFKSKMLKDIFEALKETKPCVKK